LNGVLEHLGRIFEIHFLLDVLTIRLDRFHTHVERIGDLARSVPLADQAKYF